MSKLPFTHLTYPERRPVTALTIPHRHNEGTRLVLDERGRTFRQATLDQLGQEVLDAIYAEHKHTNPQAKAIQKRYQRGEITKEEYVAQVDGLFAGDNEGFVKFILNGLSDSAKRAEAVEKYLLARSMVDANHVQS